MSVKAKFKVSRWETSGYKYKIDPKGPWVPENVKTVEQRTIFMEPVYSNRDGSQNEENKKFFAATPSGEIKMGVVNQEAWPYFELDTEYYVTFEKAE
jgi:hypothetical protein